MRSVGVRELKEQASEILRRVREEGEAFEVTYHGRVVARLVPVTQAKQETSVHDFWKRWQQLSREISGNWPQGVSAVEAVREGRREVQ